MLVLVNRIFWNFNLLVIKDKDEVEVEAGYISTKKKNRCNNCKNHHQYNNYI